MHITLFPISDDDITIAEVTRQQVQTKCIAVVSLPTMFSSQLYHEFDKIKFCLCTIFLWEILVLEQSFFGEKTITISR